MRLVGSHRSDDPQQVIEFVIPFTFEGRRYERGVIIVFNDGSRLAMTPAQFQAWNEGHARRMLFEAASIG